MSQLSIRTESRRLFTDKVHEFSSLQINLPEVMADKIMRWGRLNISNEDLYDNDNLHGREDEIHVTLLYGIHSPSCSSFKDIINDYPPFITELGKLSIFTTNDNFDVVKIEASGPSLFYLNSFLKNKIANTQNYEYSPHVTIAYVKKNKVKINDVNKFNSWKWTASTVMFSSKNGGKVPIKLNTLKQIQYY